MIRFFLAALLVAGLGQFAGGAAPPTKRAPAKAPVSGLGPRGARPPASALANRLLPDPLDQVDGNAGPLWISAGLAAREVRYKWTEKQWNWFGLRGTPLDKL